MKTKQQSQDKTPVEMGNSPFTQAMGEAGNVGLAAFAVSTVVVGAILYFGRDQVKWIHNGIEKIEKGFTWIRDQLGGNGKGTKKADHLMASLGAASVIGTIIGKIVMIPAYRNGLNKAKAEKAFLKSQQELVVTLQEQVEEKDQELGRLHMQLKKQSAEDLLDKEDSSKTFADSGMKKPPIASRGAHHASAIESEEPAERGR